MKNSAAAASEMAAIQKRGELKTLVGAAARVLGGTERAIGKVLTRIEQSNAH